MRRAAVDPGLLVSEVVIQIVPVIVIVIVVLNTANKPIQIVLILVYPDRELLCRLLLQNVVNDPELTNIHAQGQD